MKNKKYLVDELAIRYSPKTGKESKYKTIPTDIGEGRRGHGCTENTSEVETNKEED